MEHRRELDENELKHGAGITSPVLAPHLDGAGRSRPAWGAAGGGHLTLSR
jgi:hypothetical protein